MRPENFKGWVVQGGKIARILLKKILEKVIVYCGGKKTMND